MGNTESSLEGEARSPSIIESENSPRNVLERYAKNIRQASKDENEHVDSLKGDLTKAEFRGGPSTPVNKHNYYYPYPCNLDHKEHTNLRYDDVNLRHPCHGREQNRFDEDEESECGNKIRNYKRENDAIACAPPRRRHMCDKNLEALNDINTQNIHDLLGNVLVTAKYEGESIVNNHPHKGTSDVCTALARSFADIGDIVRGIDMFKPNVHDKVEKTFFFGCGGILCTAVPGWSIICSIGFYAFLNTNAMEAVVKADIAKVLNELKEITVLDTLFEDKLGSLVTVETYDCPNALNQAIMVSKESVCSVAGLQRASCGSTRFFIPSEIVPKVHGATVEGIAVVKDAATKTRNTAFSSPFFFF